jgi:hypothetical protein
MRFYIRPFFGVTLTLFVAAPCLADTYVDCKGSGTYKNSSASDLEWNYSIDSQNNFRRFVSQRNEYVPLDRNCAVSSGLVDCSSETKSDSGGESFLLHINRLSGAFHLQDLSRQIYRTWDRIGGISASTDNNVDTVTDVSGSCSRGESKIVQGQNKF